MAKKNREDQEGDGAVSDLFKKILRTGIDAASLTEDAFKNVLSEINAKDIVEKIFSNAKTTKEDVIGVVKHVVGDYIGRLDVSKEIEKVLDKYDIHVEADVKFKKKDETNSKK